jgi:hypothetical protein
MSGVRTTGKPTVVATGPGWVENLEFKSKGVNTATVAQVYINNGSPIEDEKNNALYFEGSLPATSKDEYAFPMQGRIQLPKGFRVFIKLTDAVSAGWSCNEVDLPCFRNNYGVPARFSNTVCALCKAPAYLGFNQVECHNTSCRNYRP